MTLNDLSVIALDFLFSLRRIRRQIIFTIQKIIFILKSTQRI